MSRLNIIRSTTPYLLLLLLIGLTPQLHAQEAVEESATPELSDEQEPETPEPSASVFSIEGAAQLMTEADRAIDAQEYEVAAQKLQNARQIYNQLSNFYLQLFNSFTGLDNTAAESHRKKALDTSLERDRATYQLALVHRAQNKSELSIPLLIQIITSQSPGIGLGRKAYDQLLEIGFVDVPYTQPKPGEVESPPTAPQPNVAPEQQPQQPPTEGQVPSAPIPNP
ncbi:MAG: hypothetical protein AAFQ41_04615 [Cyanobacteria bacterium J06623_7]